MANVKYKPGMVFGNWEILEKLESKKYGNPVYLVKNKVTNNKKETTTSALQKSIQKNSTNDKPGKPNKWRYTVDENGFIKSKELIKK